MVIEGVRPFDTKSENVAEKALGYFIEFIEKRLGVSVIRPIRAFPYDRPDLGAEFLTADVLKEHGIIKNLSQAILFPDEPPIKRWWAICNDAANHSAGGASFRSDADALRSTLAEALERYVWTEARDRFVGPRMSVAEIATRGQFIAPERFAGFSSEQRAADPALYIEPTSVFLWTRGHSLVTGKDTYVPAQTISGVRDIRMWGNKKEPLIRTPITTGIATWTEKKPAQLQGALEIIERDAYMIWWLNQLHLPRIAISNVCKNDTLLAEAVERCARYRLKTHVVRLLTDAPAFSICVVLEDTSNNAPRFAFGLKTHRSLARAIEGAMLEALRARAAYRTWATSNVWDVRIPVRDIGHIDRIYYWGVPEHAQRLEELLAGPEQEPQHEIWENDTAEEHLERIVTWCRNVGYEFVTVSLGTSSLNPTGWSVEAVVIPELQPTYLFEKVRSLGGRRLKDIPERFGFASRPPFTDAPHPFA